MSQDEPSEIQTQQTASAMGTLGLTIEDAEKKLVLLSES
jgi:hypothetical protein